MQASAERDYEQIGLHLTGHARVVASDVRRRADQLPKGSGEVFRARRRRIPAGRQGD